MPGNSEPNGPGAAQLGTPLDSVVDRFDACWASGTPPEIDGFLPASPPSRLTVLRELVHIDLERRLKRREAARVESYLKRYPELASDPSLVEGLILAEFTLRQRLGPEPTREEFQRRFPEQFPQALKRLSTVGDPLHTLPHAQAPPNQEARHAVQIPGYEILGELGRGGMGVVYRARQIEPPRPVALKVILSGSHASAEQRARFVTEAHTVARLDHPNIVQVYAVGEHEGQLFFSLQFVGGGSLDRQLDGTPWPPRRAAALVETLAGAMEYAHRQGVIHRDLKPANVLITDCGLRIADSPGQPDPQSAIKITDFGLAKIIGDENGRTASGVIAGTPSYMATEQAAGRISAIGPATDVYSLGAVLYELLTGRPPFRGATLTETVEQVLSQDPVPPRRLQSKVPADLETICLKCLEKQPYRRYLSAQALADDLRRYLNDEPISARPVGRAERLGRWCRRHPSRAVAAGLGLCLLAAAVVVPVVFGAIQAQHNAALKQAAGDLAEKGRALTKALAEAKENEEKAKKNEKRAEEHAAEATRNRIWAERQSVGQVLERGLEHCRQDHVSVGLLWLSQALAMAERSESTAAQQNTIRLNLAVWARQLHPLRHTWTHQAGHMANVLDPQATDRPASNPRPWNLGHRAIAFRPDSKAIALCQGKAVRVYDVVTGQPIGPPLTHPVPLLAVAFSPDGKTLLTAAGREARTWDLSFGAVRHRWPHPRNLASIAFSPDGKCVATGCEDGQVRLWNLATGKTIGDPLTAGGLVASLAFSTDGKRLLGADRLWDLSADPPTAQTLAGVGGEAMHTAVFSPDGTSFAAAWERVNLWRLPAGTLHATQQSEFPPAGAGPVWSVVFSPDGKRLLILRVAGQALLWDVPAGQVHRNLSGSMGVMSGAFSRDGRTCWVGYSDGKVRAYDTDTGRPLGVSMEHSVGILLVLLSPDGRTVLTWDIDGTVCLWEAEARPLQPRPVVLPKDTVPRAFGPDGRTFATLAGNAVRLYDSATHQPVGLPLDHPAAVAALVYRPDGQVLLTGSADGTVRQWNTRTAEAAGPAVPAGKGLQALYWSPGGSKFLTVSAAGAQCWDARSGAPLGKPFPIGDPFAFTEDGRVIRAEGHSMVASVRDALTGRPLGPQVRQPAIIAGLALLYDGKVLAARGETATTHLWDAATGKDFCPPLVHREIVRLLLPSPDSRRLLTGGLPKPDGQNFQLWDTATGRPMGPPIPTAQAAVFSPDGKFLVTAHGRQLRLWEAESGKQAGPDWTNPGPARSLNLSNGAVSLWVDGDGLHQWDLATWPIQGKAERIVCWLEAITGYYLDLPTELPRRLSAEALAKRRMRLTKLGGPPPTRDEPRP